METKVKETQNNEQIIMDFSLDTVLIKMVN